MAYGLKASSCHPLTDVNQAKTISELQCILHSTIVSLGNQFLIVAEKNDDMNYPLLVTWLRLVPPLQNCSFCENCFCHNLKTNKVKYIKVYIFRKGISQGIYLNSQIFG